MKYFVLLTGFILACYLLGFIKKPEKYQWMDRNYTTTIKGFSILTVVWVHIGAMLSVGGIQFIARNWRSTVLMCSGYGLEISYEKERVKGFLEKRILGVCLPILDSRVSRTTWSQVFFPLRPIYWTSVFQSRQQDMAGSWAILSPVICSSTQ